jgi:hypothetical protein
VSSGVLGLALATIAPSFGLPLGLALYLVLKEAKGYASFGAVMFYVGMTLALVHEVLRIVLFWRMPGLYQGATEAARPAVLALGDLVGHAQEMLALISFVIMFGGGCSALALAIKMMVFFLWLIAMGVTLLRWRPAPV